MKKVPATFDLENSLWKKNKKYIVGIDEVGRGAWAGPLVAAAVVFPTFYLSKINYYDSKLLKPKERESLSEIIKEESVCFGIGKVEVAEINEWGLTRSTQTAYSRALENLSCEPDHYLIDAFYIQSLSKTNQTPIIHGDYLCSSIAAASVVAKVFRDKLMKELANHYPNYFLEKHKGYGTKAHQQAILSTGLTDIHRVNYNLKILND